MSKRKSSDVESNFNHDFCSFLLELAEYEKNVSRNIHKYNAYRKAASVLASHCKRVQSGEEAKKLNGIGEKIAKKIDEFLQTGKLKKLENIHQNDEAQAISQLTRVSGIGPVKAADLFRAGIKTIEELKNHVNLLNHHQVLGLKYYEDLEKKIPRSEIQKIEEEMLIAIKKLDTQYGLTICGSYRRGKSSSGDIDALVTHPSLKVEGSKRKHGENQLKIIVEALKGLVTDTLSIGETKFMGICRLSNKLPYRRLDIRLIPHNQYYCAILYFTGSDVFNKTMRAHALENGFTLNEYMLRPVGVTGIPGEPVPISSEEEIFEYIDYPYRSPDQRNM